MEHGCYPGIQEGKEEGQFKEDNRDYTKLSKNKKKLNIKDGIKEETDRIITKQKAKQSELRG